jgi:diguanylate cyclase (GGDEF)-like protein
VFSLQQMSEIMSAIPDPVYILTRTGRYAAILGGSDSRYYQHSRNLVGKSIRDVLNEKKADWLIRKINKALDVDYLQVVEYNLPGDDAQGGNEHKSNRLICFEGHIQALKFQVDGEDAVLWMTSNIAMNHQLKEKVSSRRETDALTGLWNRRYFEQAVAQELNKAICDRCAVSLLLLNIDDFKLIKDTQGHKVGDSVLCEIASLIGDCTRESDVIFRWGDQEFAILMPSTDLERAASVAERLRKTVEIKRFKAGQKVTVSVGYTDWYFEKESFEHLISKAAQAIDLAKNSGRNRIECFK